MSGYLGERGDELEEEHTEHHCSPSSALALLFWVCTNSSIRCRDFPGGPVVKNLLCNVRNVGLIPGRETGIPHVMEKLSLHPVPSLNVK